MFGTFFSLTVVTALYVGSALVLPFPHWPAVGAVIKSVVTGSNVSLLCRVSMLGYVIRQVVGLPIYAAFWLLDELLSKRHNNVKVRSPIFIIGQPRSGTTLLHRTLSEDTSNFVSARHYEWRYPSICFWRLLDRLGLQQKLAAKNYWPNSPLGRLCAKIHRHTLGMHEEMGIFFEEKMFMHYFVFRRFPFPSVLDAVTEYSKLSEASRKKFQKAFLKVITKVIAHRGEDKIFLSKENESVELYRILLELFPDAKLIFIVRPSSEFVSSYRNMSVNCTEVKHGVDPTKIPLWDEANMNFRRRECAKYIEFVNEVGFSHDIVKITFKEFTTDILGTVGRIYDAFNLEISDRYAEKLQELSVIQRSRKAGYKNDLYECSSFEFFDDFVTKVSTENTGITFNSVVNLREA